MEAEESEGFTFVKRPRRRANARKSEVDVMCRSPVGLRSSRMTPGHQTRGGGAEAAMLGRSAAAATEQRAATTRPGGSQGASVVSFSAARNRTPLTMRSHSLSPPGALPRSSGAPAFQHQQNTGAPAFQTPQTKAPSAVSTVACSSAVSTVARAASQAKIGGPVGAPHRMPSLGNPCGHGPSLATPWSHRPRPERSSHRMPSTGNPCGLGPSLVGPKLGEIPARNKLSKRSKEKQELQSLQAVYPQGVNSVAENGGWEEIELAVDSGATETVVGEDMLHSIKTTEGESFKRAVEYEVANGVTIPNLGEKCFVAVAEEGQRRKMRAQVCSVNKALLGVSRMVQAGNRVVFEQSGSYVEDLHSGERMHMEEKGGMYMLKVWVERGF